MLDLSTFFALLVGGSLFGIAALWLYYDRRDHHYYDLLRQRHAFHCVKCGTLYSLRQHEEVGKCPVCGFQNQRLKF
ncbi:MAG: hypothetical protein E1N59_2508 [Puniceicoccaceae bacterium 5H]|nr:MAG: hypothetical protein E1N59_2508 [Puniceicoccaceae bacterium 5H]